MREIRLTGTTNASGALTVQALGTLFGRLYAVEWIDGGFDDGVDAVLSVVETPSEVDQTLLTLTNANNDEWYFPREIVHDLSGGALTGTSGGDREKPVVSGRLQLVVSNGGNVKTGGCIVYLED